MKYSFRHGIIMSALVTVFAFSACKKDNSSQSDTQNDAITTSQETAEAEGEYDDATEIGLSAGAGLDAGATGRVDGSSNERVYLFADLQFKIGLNTIVTVTPADSTFPKTVTIDYGAGTICRDGRFRKGVVVLTFSAPFRTTGATVTITFKDYYSNRLHIEGTKTIVNLSSGGVLKYSVDVKDGKVSWPNGRSFTVTGTKVVTQVAGSGTATVRDDAYSVEGSATIVYANGTTVTRSTVTPLIKAVSCNWIGQGILKITVNNTTVTIDFGDGTCDNKAILKWNNGQKEITLP